MPKRTDIKSILILGAGPIVIGQACEFDYSGAQACKALREEGYRVILVNSNPATIMTDPEMADATYIEPIHWEVVRKIIEKERPDAVLPTMGGQTALNCALELERQGVLEEFGVTMIGATADAIDKAEDRRRFDVAMKKIGLETARSGIAHSMEEALAVAAVVGFPCIIRPSFTMGGSGGGIAYNREEFEEICARGLDLSPTKELLIDESLIGWKEYEMEVVRDHADNCIIVCSIENLDPMGIHTGDSITVAPAQTLTDKEYQIMRNASIAILREIGVDTGGSNVQFAVNPKNGRLIVIDGGFCRAYQPTTGIAGYTLIYNSACYRLVSHEPFVGRAEAIRTSQDIASTSVVFERLESRLKIAGTDVGRQLQEQIDDLMALLLAYRSGAIAEDHKEY